MSSPVIGTITPGWAVGLTEHDQQLLEQMAAEERQFHRLYVAGEIRPTQTPSEGDYELALMAARHTRDVEQIKRLMATSPLARVGNDRDAKWTRHKTYWDRTIAAALERENSLLFLGYEMKRRGLIGAAGQEAEQALEVSVAELAQNPEMLATPSDVSAWLIKRGLLTMLVGREKLSGKSTLGASDAASAARAGHTVLWVDVEQGHHRVVKRFIDLGAPLEHLMTLRRWPRTWEDVETVIATVRPDAIYVDSVSSFLMAVENGVPDASEGERWQALVGRFKRWTTLGLPDAGVCALLHATKADGSYRGSTGIGAAPDLITTMRNDEDNKTWRWLETIGRWEVPKRCLRFAGETTGYVVVGASEQEAAKPGAKTLASLVAFMGTKRWLASDLAAGLNWSKDKTQNVLNTGREQGKVAREHGGPRGAFLYFTTSTAATTADAPTLLESVGAIGGGADCVSVDIGGDRRSRWSDEDGGSF